MFLALAVSFKVCVDLQLFRQCHNVVDTVWCVLFLQTTFCHGDEKDQMDNLELKFVFVSISRVAYGLKTCDLGTFVTTIPYLHHNTLRICTSKKSSANNPCRPVVPLYDVTDDVIVYWFTGPCTPLDRPSKIS